MLIDLHAHTHYSDGRHSPGFVLSRAKANGITDLALTDHDCLDGLLSLGDSPLPEGIRLITGLEISSLWESLEIHVIGLGVNPADRQLGELLARQQAERRLRIEQIAAGMEGAGIGGLREYMQALPCVAQGRSHVADFLVDSGRAKSRAKAFRWLGRKGRFFVEPRWCTMPQAIEAISAAGGLPVIAHPHRYGLGKARLRRLLEDFKTAGGQVMEVCGAAIDDRDRQLLAGFASRLGLWASAGSDFHATAMPWAELGRLPPLPEACIKNAIWLHPGWRSLQQIGGPTCV